VNVFVQGKVVSRPFRLLTWDGRRAALESDGQRHELASASTARAWTSTSPGSAASRSRATFDRNTPNGRSWALRFDVGSRSAGDLVPV
jgi:hypothetical protein